jgi:hypothetical protein
LACLALLPCLTTTLTAGVLAALAMSTTGRILVAIQHGSAVLHRQDDGAFALGGIFRDLLATLQFLRRHRCASGNLRLDTRLGGCPVGLRRTVGGRRRGCALCGSTGFIGGLRLLAGLRSCLIWLLALLTLRLTLRCGLLGIACGLLLTLLALLRLAVRLVTAGLLSLLATGCHLCFSLGLLALRLLHGRGRLLFGRLLRRCLLLWR